MMQVFTFPYFLQTPHAEVYNATKLLLYFAEHPLYYSTNRKHGDFK